MHDPIGSRAMQRFPRVEDEHHLHPHQLFARRRHHWLRLSDSLPVAGDRGSVATVVRGALYQIEKVPVSFVLA